MAQILVIDDEKNIRVTFESLLFREGHEVVTADSHSSALEAIVYVFRTFMTFSVKS